MTSQLTHSGAIAYRVNEDGAYEFLLVTAKRHPKDWIFPKGHIEYGETAETAATRELLEEAGVHGVVDRKISDLERMFEGLPIRTRYFLVAAGKDEGPNEGRRSKWLLLDDAVRRLTFADAKALLKEGARLLSQSR